MAWNGPVVPAFASPRERSSPDTADSPIYRVFMSILGQHQIKPEDRTTKERQSAIAAAPFIEAPCLNPTLNQRHSLKPQSSPPNLQHPHIKLA